MASVLVFDVNETLLDLRALDQHFERIFGDSSIRKQWFGLVLRNAFSLTITGAYQDFVAVGAASLVMVAEQHQVSVSDDDRAGIGLAMTSLPAHRDVVPNLERLTDAQFRMAALTTLPRRQPRANSRARGSPATSSASCRWPPRLSSNPPPRSTAWRPPSWESSREQ